MPPDPDLAQDGQALVDQALETRNAFSAMWGERAAAAWIREHDLVLSSGKTPDGPRIGLLYAGSAFANPAFTQGLARGFRTVGYTPGQDISIVWRFAKGRAELLPALAADLVQLPVAVIVATGLAESVAAKRATSTIPIVTMTVPDPVGAGLVASLDRPGGNLTGVIQQPAMFNAERLAFLKEAVPTATRVAVLTSVVAAGGSAFAVLRDAAVSLGLELQALVVARSDDLEGAFGSAKLQLADAMIVLADTMFTANRAQIARLARQYCIPALYPSRLFIDAGGLMDYAFVEGSRGQSAANYVAQILDGAKPAELPMRAPSEFELVVNLQAAQAIGYTAKPSVLARATDVIR